MESVEFNIIEIAELIESMGGDPDTEQGHELFLEQLSIQPLSSEDIFFHTYTINNIKQFMCSVIKYGINL